MRKILRHSNFVDHHMYYPHGDLDAGNAGILMLPGEINIGPSMTVPGSNLSLRQLLERYSMGQNVQTFQGTYTDDDIIPDNFERLDQHDRIELLQRVTTLAVSTQGHIRAQAAERATDAAQKAAEAAYQNRKQKEQSDEKKP